MMAIVKSAKLGKTQKRNLLSIVNSFSFSLKAGIQSNLEHALKEHFKGTKSVFLFPIKAMSACGRFH